MYRIKRSKSGAQKRKEAATARDAVAKLPKMTDFFKITEQSRPGTSTERDEENYSVQEKEDYDDQHQSDCEFPENLSCDLSNKSSLSLKVDSHREGRQIPRRTGRASNKSLPKTTRGKHERVSGRKSSPGRSAESWFHS